MKLIDSSYHAHVHSLTQKELQTWQVLVYATTFWAYKLSFWLTKNCNQ